MLVVVLSIKKHELAKEQQQPEGSKFSYLPHPQSPVASSGENAFLAETIDGEHLTLMPVQSVDVGSVIHAPQLYRPVEGARH